ncbi:response regulator [Radiobacillus sp. PE A8.2]|uniref:response regulator n=1 Tax=Radiobacillus sp. PE A8.2 TaxID=3380349 RepID=UPI00388DBFC6
MYKLLIAEDEDTIRQGIISTIDWNKHNIDICAEATNGQQALDLMSLHQPDIVLTDIQMPKMSGLAFIRSAKQQGYTFESIVLTGFEDFNYATDSIRLNVFDYMLKPAQPSKILAAVLKIIQKLEHKKLVDKQLHMLEHYTDKSIYYDKVEQLTRWFHFPESAPLEKRLELLPKLKMKINNSEALHVGMLSLTPRQENQFMVNDYELLKFACINITTETLSAFYNNKIEVIFDHDALVWIGNVSHNYEPNNLKSYLSTLLDNFKAYLNLTICVGVGSAKESIIDIHQSYNEAHAVLDEQFYHREEHFFFHEEIHDAVEKQILHDKELAVLEDEIITHMYNKMYDSALDKLENWLSYLEENSYYHKEQINLKAITLIVEMQKFVQGNTLTKIEWESDLINWIEQLPTMRTFDDMSSILKKIFRNVFEILTAEKSVHHTVQRAQAIIEKRYSDNITLESVANEVFVSSAYLSSLFKQELGINFLDYLHQYRVAQAKVLLTKNLKIYEVANKTGYNDERHFSSTFKKWTGITPSRFQKETKIVK